jgi:hypothetical protein
MKNNKFYTGVNSPSNGIEKMVICENAMNEIMRTVGSKGPESGGILLGSREDFVIQKFIFDPKGSTSYSSYDPDVQFLNSTIKREWAENGLALLGFLHSHPRGVERLSGDWGNNTGDIGYIKAILRAIPDLKKFLAPVMFSPADGKGSSKIFPYVAYRGNEANYITAELKVIKDSDYLPMWTKEPIKPTREKKQERRFNPARLYGSVNPALMQKTHAVCVGVGGANGICESLVRTGLGKITLIDFDVVDDNNLVTQGFYISDIGKPKVEALKERLLNINSHLEVKIYNRSFLELTDEEQSEIFKNANLLMMMTDNFHAQAYGNITGLKYQVPTIFALMYAKARCAEITFMVPGLTPTCHRCAVSGRYNAYLNEGFKNNVTSTGSTNFHTQYLNSAIGLLALALLHRNTKGFEFSNWFGEKWEKNLIQLRTSPFYESKLFEKTFENNNRVFCFDSVWQTITPDCPPQYSRCPDCGGYGDLRKGVQGISQFKALP